MNVPHEAAPALASPRVGGWSPWWFPVTYALHVAEEYWGGESFPRWISRLAQVQFTAPAFVRLNAVAMGAMLVAVWCLHRGRCRPLAATLGAIVLINGLAHTIGSLVTWSYSPGLVTGLFLWVPLGVAALRRAHGELGRGWLWSGIGAGVGVHALVSSVVLASGA